MLPEWCNASTAVYEPVRSYLCANAETFFCVVDLHAITLPHEPKALLQATRSSAATYLACGIDPAKANIFVQSHVSAHSELTWLLSCGPPIGWLRKMVQFKEKSQSRVRVLLPTSLITMTMQCSLQHAILSPVCVAEALVHAELTACMH